MHRLFGQRNQRDVPAQWFDGVSIGGCGHRFETVLAGAIPRALLWLLAPTALAVTLDLVLRARSLAGLAARGQAIYLSSILVSAGFWVFPLRLGVAPAGLDASVGPRHVRAGPRPFCCRYRSSATRGRPSIYRLFHAYMGRDTLRLGIALRGTVVGWFASWGVSVARRWDVRRWLRDRRGRCGRAS